MPITPIPLATRSNPGREFQDGSGRLINCYVEPREQEGRHPTPIYPVDGTLPFTELPRQSETGEEEGELLFDEQVFGDGITDNLLQEDGSSFFLLEGDPFAAQREDPDLGVQVLLVDNGYLWAITGRGVYKINEAGTATFIGAINGSSSITADVNRDNQIAVVSDGRYYVVNTLDDSITDYTEYDDGVNTGPLYAPNSVCHYNGYMVVAFSFSRWQISNLDDARYFDVSDIASNTFRGDDAKRVLTRGGDLLIFGERSLEFWQDVGATNGFTMARVTSLEIGIGPPLSAANIDETVLFVDDNLAVRQITGYQTVTVSTPYIARKIRQASDTESIRAHTYQRDGHKFYSISCSDFTLTYNLSTQLWHEEKTYGLNRRLIGAVAQMNNKWYAGHYAEGVVLELSPDVYTDRTDHLVMEMETPPVHAFPDRIRVKSLFIDALFGKGLVPEVDEVESARMGESPTPSDSIDSNEENPKLLVYISEDSGENWIFLEELALGDINSKYQELRVQGVGTSEQNGFSFRIVCSPPSIRGILGMAADLTKVRS